MKAIDPNLRPTKETYDALQFAYDFFNARLFGNSLKGVLITLNNVGRSFGHYSPERFTRRDGEVCDQINLNSTYFASRPVEDTLSTLGHEMVHQWRQYEGEQPPRRSYHDKVFAQKMIDIGLQPSHTGSPGGKTVGEHMSHYILPDGQFIQVCKELLTHTFGIIWFDRFPATSGKNYSYAGTVVVPAKSAKPVASLGIESGSGESGMAEPESGTEVEVPVFSAIPQTEGGLNLAARAEPGMVSGGAHTRSVDSSNRVKYTCDGCGNNIWGKPNLNVSCDDCRMPFKQRH
ncbi:TPA: SprT-like domain-containing protein [Burkholderia lata]